MKPIGLQDFMEYRFLCELQLSPDERHLSFTGVQCQEEQNSYQKDLYLVHLPEGQARRMTFQGDASSAVWLSSDSLLFPALRDSKDRKKLSEGEAFTVYYRLFVDGGEAEEYMRIPASVEKLIPLAGDLFAAVIHQDNGAIPVNGLEGEARSEAVKRREEEKDYDVFDEIPFWGNGRGVVNKTRSRLCLFDRKTGALTPLVDEWTDCGCVRAIGDKLYFSASRYTDISRLTASIRCLHWKENRLETLLEDGLYSINDIRELDGRLIFLGCDGLTRGSVQSDDLFWCENGKARLIASLPDGIGDSVSSDCKYGGGSSIVNWNDKLCFIATEDCSSQIRCVDAEGRVTTLFCPDGSVNGIAAGKAEIWFIGMQGGGLQELYRIGEDGRCEALTDFNGWVLRDCQISRPEPVSFESDGVEIHGYVMKPVDFDPTRSYPGILTIHGGPRVAFGSVFTHEMQYWASQGYFVFYCNPRGADGRGDDFADLRGRYGTIDYDDLMRFTDVVLRGYPQIDPRRVAATGGSYGGYMVNWIIGHTDRFACCCAQRSISNWVSKCLVTDIGHLYDMDQQGSTPWENFNLMWKLSPIRYADKAKTPTLFIHSDQDYRCWQAEGLQMFTALKLHGVDARLCLFHGENHNLSRSGKPLHRVRRLREMTEWFDRYCQQNPR